MYCKSCGAKLNDNQAVCLNCGVKVGEGNKYCANCGSQVDQNADVCLNCGVAIKKNKDDGEYLGGQNKVTIALVCFFLGGLGIHNFMMGETKKGIFRIAASFCCGLGCIFALIDFIRILMGNYEVNKDKLI